MAQEWYQYPVTRGFTWLWDAIVRHSGIDYGAPCGTPLTSPVDGKVLHSGVQPWGGQIDILAPDIPGYDTGPHVVTFLHSSAQYVRVNQEVKKGDIVGASGQPPPGAPQYGSGCHVHFEVTHGSTAPYTTYSPSRNPSSTGSYPESPAPLIHNLHGGGGIGARAQFAQADCGPEPLPSDPDYQNKLTAWLECMGKIPTPTSGTYGQTPLEGIGSALGNIANFFSAHNLFRGVKIILGGALLLVGFVLAFLPDIGAGVATAAGGPEFAGPVRRVLGGGPRGVAKGTIGGLATIPGTQRAATRAKEREQKAARQATAHAYAVQQRETAKRVERANATTAKLFATSGRKTPTGNKIVRVGTPARNAPPAGGPVRSGAGRIGFTETSRPRTREEAKAAPTGKAAQERAEYLRRRAAEPPPGLKQAADLLKTLQPEGPKGGRQRRINQRGIAPRKQRLAHAPRQLPSVQNQPERAAAAKRKVAQAIKRRRTGKG